MTLCSVLIDHVTARRCHSCGDGCETTNYDGTGRVCDIGCDRGVYGNHGCSANDGEFGMYCRVCYNDLVLAQQNDYPNGDRAIM